MRDLGIIFRVRTNTVFPDLYASLMSLPQTLTLEKQLIPLQPYAIYTLSALVESQAFHIFPASTLHPLDPRELPREIFVQNSLEPCSQEASDDPSQPGVSTAVPETQKKKGRPTKGDKRRKALLALNRVDKWLGKNTLIIQPPVTTSNSTADGSEPGEEPADGTPPAAPVMTHVLISHPPTATLDKYRTQKKELLDLINPNLTSSAPEDHTGMVEKTAAREALECANEAVLARLKRLDRMAAEKGLEVGGEGGERTGLERVGRAVAELHDADATSAAKGGILGLLEGGGLGALEAGTSDQSQPD